MDENEVVLFDNESKLFEIGEDEYYLDYDQDFDYTEAVITFDHIKQIGYELGLITLCWPEIDEPIFGNRTHFPESYYTNSNKERLALLYAENLRKQFLNLYPNRRPLVLVADNECGLQKLLCTHIRPTTLPFLELKTWDGCAQFVADHIDYEPLERPTLAPERVVGPYTVFKRQIGNSFEMATALCSILVGAGFDAYVVMGYATQDIAQGIRMRTECPVKFEEETKEVAEETVQEKKYELRPIRDLRSKFLLYMEQREIDKIIEKEEAEKERHRLEMEELERAPEDEIYGWRVHAWVLLLPKREITEPTFVEASTGVHYPIATDVYITVESIWNHENYWINLQDCTLGLSDLTFNLTDLKCWEHLFIGEPIEHRTIPMSADADLDENTSLDEKHLDMPTPWPERIDISHEMLKSRFTNGSKITRYKRTILQQYGEYVQLDGLKHRINHYSDLEYTDLEVVEDVYENRKDCLVTIKTDVKKNLITEYFTRGREDCCKKHIYYNEKNTIECKRIMEFFTDFRLDGLDQLEMDPLFLKENFKNREDFLYFRHTIFAPRGNPPPGFVEGARRIVVSITEKFNRNNSKNAHNDIAVREFALVDNEIHIKYHYAKGHVTANTRHFIKPSLTELGEGLTFNPELTSGYMAEVGMKPPKQLKLFYLLEQQLIDEQNAQHHLRDIEDEVTAFIRTRSLETAIPQLNVSLFNQEQNEEYRQGLKEKEQELQAKGEREVDQDIDYLAPYLVRLNIKPPFSKDLAVKARVTCLKEFKALLVFRANKLRQQFEKEYSEFQKKQNWFANNVSLLNVEEEEIELNNLALTKYKLQLYDIRMQRHKDLSSYRYKALELYLKLDPRLKVYT